MSPEAERARKIETANLLKMMRASEAYARVLERIDQRCGKWFHAWVLASPEDAEKLRRTAAGYSTFDLLVREMINEGAAAEAQGDNCPPPQSGDKEN